MEPTKQKLEEMLVRVQQRRAEPRAPRHAAHHVAQHVAQHVEQHQRVDVDAAASANANVVRPRHDEAPTQPMVMPPVGTEPAFVVPTASVAPPAASAPRVSAIPPAAAPAPSVPVVASVAHGLGLPSSIPPASSVTIGTSSDRLHDRERSINSSSVSSVRPIAMPTSVSEEGRAFSESAMRAQPLSGPSGTHAPETQTSESQTSQAARRPSYSPTQHGMPGAIPAAGQSPTVAAMHAPALQATFGRSETLAGEPLFSKPSTPPPARTFSSLLATTLALRVRE